MGEIVDVTIANEQKGISREETIQQLMEMTGGSAKLALSAPAVGSFDTTKKPRAPSSRGKNEPQLWLSMDEFKKELTGGKPMCAYVPSRGKNASTFCAAPPINLPDLNDPDVLARTNPLDFRCKKCSLLTSANAKKLFGQEKPVMGRVVPGVNIPSSSSSAAAKPAPSASASASVSQPSFIAGLALNSQHRPNIPVVKPSPVSAAKDDFLAIELFDGEDAYLFPEDRRYRQLAVRACDNKCLGRVRFDVSRKTKLGSDWMDFDPPTQEDSDFLSEYGIEVEE